VGKTYTGNIKDIKRPVAEVIERFEAADDERFGIEVDGGKFSASVE
jgi:hypothetical protein